MIDNLWPEDIATITMRAPSAILREQASKLGERTKNIVIAEVVTAPESNNRSITHRFNIIAPALNNYTYRLFYLNHNVTTMYPVNAYIESELYEYYTGEKAKEGVIAPIIINDEPSLMHFLGNIFAADKTRRIIASLLAQSQGLPSDAEDLPF